MEAINKDQIKTIHILLSKRKDSIETKIEMKKWFKVESTKDLTYKQANEAIVILGGEAYVNYTNLKYGKFDSSNIQHHKILNVCKRLRWTKINPKTGTRIADIETLGGWLREHSPKKPLMKCNTAELSSVIKQLEAIESKDL